MDRHWVVALALRVNGSSKVGKANETGSRRKKERRRRGSMGSRRQRNNAAVFIAFPHASTIYLLSFISLELMGLRERWEADKAKVEKLKASRRFKPY
jgi:hypothetical protein